ncbi:MAG: hypothetical protein WC216_01410 [Gallionella sp.]|jgi:hypothetical protein
MHFDWSYWQNRADKGQGRRALMGRRLVWLRSHAAFAALDFDVDDPFLEPTLVAAAQKSPNDVTQAMTGYIARQMLHKNERFEKLQLFARTNQIGEIILPGLGTVISDVRTSDCNIEIIRSGKNCMATLDCTERPFEVVDEKTLCRGAFRILENNHPLYAEHLAGDDGGQIPHLPVISDEQLYKILESALELIHVTFQEYSAILNNTTRAFLLFCRESVNSFASENFHGTCFLSLPAHRSLPYFIEDVLHQAGHVMMGSIFLNWDEVLTEDKHTPISKYVRRQEDRRFLFVVLHAVFTEFSIAEGLLRCLEAGVFDMQDRLEAAGRLAFVLQKFRIDIQNLYAIPSFIGDAVIMRDQLLHSLEDIWARSIPYIATADISGQIYNFDISIYKLRNAY